MHKWLLTLILLFISVTVATVIFAAPAIDRIPTLSAVLASQSPTPPGAKESAENNVHCLCAKFEVSPGYDGVKVGEEIEFYASFSDEKITIPRYDWTVKNGSIISGQGTDEIVVRTDSNSTAKSVSATVEIPLYNQMCDCPTRASASVPFSENTFIENRNEFANVEELSLNETEVVIPCSPGIKPAPGTRVSEDMRIAVSTKAVDPENDILTYNYTVSGGQIVGSGSKVEWDLTGALPGTYEITAGVDDGCGICGKTRKAVVTVTECDPTCVVADCAMVALTVGKKPGNLEEYVVTAKIAGGSVADYTWIVTNGEIVDGQGTPSVTIRVPAILSKSETTVTLEIDVGEIGRAFGCQSSESIVIRRNP